MNRKRFLFGCTSIVISALLFSCNKFEHLFPHGNGKDRKNIVYVMSNETSHNKILSYRQRTNGKLEFIAATSTGGSGAGASIGSQGSVVLSKYGKWLYTVNAGDNTISVFRVSNEGNLLLYQNINSGGKMPVSLDVYEKLLYVVNGGGNICGFKIQDDGMLQKIEASGKPLSKMVAGPAQISFRPGGKVLAVTEKMTNSITTYALNDMGVAGDPQTTDANAETPFGYAFAFHNKMIVTDAFGGRPGESQVTSYEVGNDGSVTFISRLPVFQAAACWIALSKNNKYGLLTNTASNSISSIKIDPSGELHLIDSVAAKTASSPIDIGIDQDGGYVYAISQMSQMISQFRITQDGKLKPIGDVPGLTPFASGIAIYR